jgi:hypothetical protein
MHLQNASTRWMETRKMRSCERGAVQGSSRAVGQEQELNWHQTRISNAFICALPRWRYDAQSGRRGRRHRSGNALSSALAPR